MITLQQAQRRERTAERAFRRLRAAVTNLDRPGLGAASPDVQRRTVADALRRYVAAASGPQALAMVDSIRADGDWAELVSIARQALASPHAPRVGAT